MAEPGIHRIEVTTLGDLLDLRAAEQGDRLAMVFPDHQVSYAGLAERAGFFAHGLIAAGLKPGETVGILLPNCVDAIAALFGAAKAGLYPVPVNARYKSLELADLIRRSRMRLLFISPADPASPAAPDFPALLSAAFPALAGQDRLSLDLADAPDLRQIVVLGDSIPPAPPGFAIEADFAEAGQGVSDQDLAGRRQLVKVRDPAVVMYTSGHGGRAEGGAAHPRGPDPVRGRYEGDAVLSHAGESDLDRAAHVPHRRHRVLCGHYLRRRPLCHTGFFRPEVALDQIASMRCTIVLAAFETIWLPVVNQPDFNDRDLSSVRIVMTVGVPERLRDMASRLPDAIQVSCFGMTEASSFLSLSYLTDTLEQRVTTGGHPMPGMECRVVDPVTGVDLPPGTEGELLFRGSNCFSGYLNDPELTAQVFDDEGWFHTMDVATMDPDGRVTFVSRLKDMLKVGGENVSAAEVESYLLRHPAIGIVQVVSAPDDYYVEVPAAFIQLKPGATVTEEEIIDFCVGKIATFRVPRYVRFVTEWPMSGTKIKKAILREMIAADLKEKGIARAPKITIAP
jgi:fatty-acyl-CoA synthase